MATQLYYFTGTGNTLVVATLLKNNLAEATLTPIASLKDKDIIETNADTVGFVFPVYCGGPPKIVKEFVTKLNIKNPNAYIFTATTATSQVGGTYNIVNNILKEKSLKLSSGFNIKMPGNYTVFYGAVSDKKQYKYFQKAQQNIDKALDIITNKKTTKMPTVPVLGAFFGWFYKISSKKFANLDKLFFADQNCNGCGICAKVCPVNNIKMEDNKPVWLHKCEQCFACLQWCPKTAIQAGKITTGRKRYHHPDINVNDVIGQK